MLKDREDAGKKLAEKITKELPEKVLANALILAVPRGGIIIGSQLRKIFTLPMDSIITKKIPAPGNDALTIGAVAEGGTVIWLDELVDRLGVTQEYKVETVKDKVLEMDRKKDFYRGGKELLEIRGKTVILVDDGIASGATMKAAIAVVRTFNPKEVIVAVPVIAKEVLEEIKQKVDTLIYLEAPEMFFSLDQFYEKYEQPTDEQMEEYLK